MKRLVLTALVLSVTGCAGLHAGQSRPTEQLLAEAGFKTQPADTAEKLAHLERLPADRIVRREQAGQTYYVYADPRGCKCLYAGRQQQYDRYRELARQQTAAAEATVASEEASDFRLWGLGPWP
jgi:hypothetical protein